MSQANVEIARRGFEAATQGDLSQIADILAPDVKWHGGSPEDEGACRNREQALTFMGRARREHRIGQLLDVIDAGDSVVVVMQPPAVGRMTSRPRANVTTFRDGLVVEIVAFESPRAALAYLGRAGKTPDTSDKPGAGA